ncbi:MAG: cyanophycin synthetase [Ilumatobacteraceae bacterium]|nr:cyanophycin synthetase [Ilumatobacteraceae bacterium]
MTDVLTRPGPGGDAHGGPRPELRIVREQIYRGPNYWSYERAINLTVDLGGLEEWPTNRIEGFTDRLLELVPGLYDHTCSRGHAGGLVERLHEGTWLGHVAEHIAIAVQVVAGGNEWRGKTRGTGTRGEYHVIFGYGDARVGIEAGRLAIRLVNHLIEAQPGFDFHHELEGLVRLANRSAFGPSTQALVDEAIVRDIPYMRLDEHSLVQLGQGIHQKRIRATVASSTSSLGVETAANKDLTKQLLRAVGLPAPAGEEVRDADSAVSVAHDVGFPVVLKPLDGNHGRGVSLNVNDDDSVRQAFAIAAAEARSGTVIVESHLEGPDYRVLVVGGKVVAVAERVPAHVIGDGRSTVRQLVDQTNADPRRGLGHEKVLTRIRLDDGSDELLAAQGLSLDQIPGEGKVVQLACTANMSTGGTSVDRTLEVHPENIEIAEQAAEVIGLDIAGIDIVCPDITRSIRDSGGGIVEVNAGPGFRMHTHPTVGDPQYVAKPVLDLLFPAGAPSRIPIVSVTGTNGKTTTARMLAHMFKSMGRKVGLTSTDGVFVDQRRIVQADASGPRSARMVLQNPRVDLAVFEVARGGILREGLGYERNDVAVVLNVAPDHLGLGGVDSIEKLAKVKQVIVEAVPRDGTAVLNADDPLVAEMRHACSGSVTLFSLEEHSQLVDSHCKHGGRAIVLVPNGVGDALVLRHGSRHMHIVWTHQIPATFGGRARMSIQNAMAAAGAAFAAGASLQDVRHGLRTFDTSFFLAPGRLNVTEVDGATVLIDYCHNAPAMRELGDFIDKLAASAAAQQPRRIGVVGTPGDRRDDDIRELGKVAACHFDSLIVRDDRLRGRREGEAAALIIEGIESARAEGARCAEIVAIPDERAACEYALQKLSQCDIVALCVDSSQDAWDLVQQRQRPFRDARAQRADEQPQ